MDSDLHESVAALRSGFERRRLGARFGRADAALVDQLKRLLRVPRRYRSFLEEADPLAVETRTPSESVRLLPSSEVLAEQRGFCLDEAGERIQQTRPNGWRPSWVIVAHSTLLGDPYFLDVSQPDPEGDCAVYTAMSGTEIWQPRLCASTFATFLRILAVGMEVAAGFGDDLDVDDEQVFRDTLGPKIREYDPAAVKAGHWT